MYPEPALIFSTYLIERALSQTRRNPQKASSPAAAQIAVKINMTLTQRHFPEARRRPALLSKLAWFEHNSTTRGVPSLRRSSGRHQTTPAVTKLLPFGMLAPKCGGSFDPGPAVPVFPSLVRLETNHNTIGLVRDCKCLMLLVLAYLNARTFTVTYTLVLAVCQHVLFMVPLPLAAALRTPASFAEARQSERRRRARCT